MKPIFILLAAAIFFTIPLAARADSIPTNSACLYSIQPGNNFPGCWGPLVSCTGDFTDAVSHTIIKGKCDSFCDLTATLYLWTLLFMSVIIYILLPAGVVIGAIIYMTAGANEQRLETAKGIWRKTFVGLLIAILAYVGLATLFRELGNPPADSANSVRIGWPDISCQSTPLDLPKVEELQNVGFGTTSDNSAGISDSSARAELTQRGVGIEIKDGVSLNGIRQATLIEVMRVKSDCGCPVVITSGVEGNHTVSKSEFSHANGYKIDLRLNPQLDAYIAKNPGKFKEIGVRRRDRAPLYKDLSTGAVFARERDHWDVVVAPNG